LRIDKMDVTEQLLNLLKNKSTTFVRKTFNSYCEENSYPKLCYKKQQSKWYYTQFDCKRRCRTICRLSDGEHELEIAMRKKAGYYLIIKYDRKIMFECESEVTTLQLRILNNVIEKYSGLFYELLKVED